MVTTGISVVIANVRNYGLQSILGLYLSCDFTPDTLVSSGMLIKIILCDLYLAIL